MISLLLASFTYPNSGSGHFPSGPVALRWYGVAYVLGFLLGYGGCERWCAVADCSLAGSGIVPPELAGCRGPGGWTTWLVAQS